MIMVTWCLRKTQASHLEAVFNEDNNNNNDDNDNDYNNNNNNNNNNNANTYRLSIFKKLFSICFLLWCWQF